jgi:hypothetical protein
MEKTRMENSLTIISQKGFSDAVECHTEEKTWVTHNFCLKSKGLALLCGVPEGRAATVGGSDREGKHGGNCCGQDVS